MSSESIFSVDYSVCEGASYEIQSRVNYLEKILELKNEMQDHIMYSEENIAIDMSNFGKIIKDEIDRYTDFKTDFINFYEDVEVLDQHLESLIYSKLNYVNAEENYNYDFLVGTVLISQENISGSNVIESLKEFGLDNKDIGIIKLLLDEENQKKIQEYANMDELDVKKNLEELGEKINKSPLDLFLYEILCGKDPRTYFNVLNDWVNTKGTSASVKIGEGLNGRYLSDKYKITGKDLKKYEKLMKDLDMYEKNIQKNKLNKSKEFQKMRENTYKFKERIGKTEAGKKVGKVKGIIGGITTTWNLWAAVDPNLKKWINGGEIDDAIAGTVIDAVGIFGGGMIGGAIVSGFGIVGAPAVVGTLVVGSFLWYWYDIIIDPLAHEYYEVSKKLFKEEKEKSNELEDWWDTLKW